MNWDLAWIVMVVGLLLWYLSLGRRSLRERRIETRPHATNPYHAVAIQVRGRGCDQARKLLKRRFLSSEAPLLPLPGCSSKTCACTYAHFDDRRQGDRRGWPGALGYPQDERRAMVVGGRRREDTLGLTVGH